MRERYFSVMIILIDKYDSFSYNLYQLIGSIEPEIKVVRNDEFTPEQLGEMTPEAIIISPGPGRPEDAGICVDTVKKLGGRIPILGVCLGHQAICASLGATVSYAKKLMHGKASLAVLDTTCPVFSGCPHEISVARYHSLAVVRESLPACLKSVAETEDGEIMAVRHIKYDIYGLQFHPESILTPEGTKILSNFVRISMKK